MSGGHIHLGLPLFLFVFLVVPFINLIMRTIAGYFHEYAFGRALAVLY